MIQIIYYNNDDTNHIFQSDAAFAEYYAEINMLLGIPRGQNFPPAVAEIKPIKPNTNMYSRDEPTQHGEGQVEHNPFLEMRCQEKLNTLDLLKWPALLEHEKIVATALNSESRLQDINFDQQCLATNEDYGKVDPTYVVDKSKSACSKQELIKIDQLLQEYDSIFAKYKYDLSIAKVEPVEIRTTIDQPVRAKYYEFHIK